MNWLHRVRWTGVRHFIRAEYGNMILSVIRTRLADGVIYQSQFAQEWWERVHGSLSTPAWVVYNGVDLDLFSPDGSNERPIDRYRLLLVEGRLGGGYEIGIETAVQLAEGLQQDRRQDIEVMIVGRVDKTIADRWQRDAQVPLHFTGVVSQSSIPSIDRSAHLLYSADINAACPNSVIEAMACGLPVVGFDTGAIPELVNEEAGRVVPYGGNPWSLDPPDLEALSLATREILLERERYSAGARARAEALFGLDRMVEGYLQALSE
jgi:glycosyltransferase involved in cell wall biosynthesis